MRPLVLPAMLSLCACARPALVPAPEPAIAAYSEALVRGDADAVYGMLSAESKRAISREELIRIIAEQRQELAEHAAEITSADRSIDARAALRHADGEVVTLAIEDGHFRIAAADALPAAARSPEQALGQLRRVLARRSYAGLLRVLSPETRAAIERDLRSLVDGLAEPDALPIEVVGDTATVIVPGGHLVRMKREDGVWRVEDFN